MSLPRSLEGLSASNKAKEKMSFLGDIRERRRETAKQVKAAKAKAKEEARHAAKLNRKAQKADAKAAKREQKHQHKLEMKEAAGRVRSEEKLSKKELKLDNRAIKRAEKLRKAQAKDEKKALKAKQRHQTKMAEKILEQQRSAGFTKDKAKSWIGGARLLVPVLVPLAYRAITAIQNREQSSSAHKFGVSADDAARHQGHGAPLLARIEATRASLKSLSISKKHGVDGFIKDAKSRLDIMTDAVSAAEKMTPEQRRRAHHSVTAELDALDRQIISELNG